MQNAYATCNLSLFSRRTGWSRNAITTEWANLGQPVWELPLAANADFVICFPSQIVHIVLRGVDFTREEATMFPIIRVRRNARTLSRQIRLSLAEPEDNWKVGNDEEGHPTLSN